MLISGTSLIVRLIISYFGIIILITINLTIKLNLIKYSIYIFKW